jgi:uncharacterized protein (TIGR02453 family)
MLTKHFTSFFKELSANNTSEWFSQNRSRYEEHVKEPFKALVADVIMGIQEHDPSIQVQPKDVIFRINRDIRFSPDKAPYKTVCGASISRWGKKAMGKPGLYFEVGAKNAAIGGGVYMPSKEELALMRGHIIHHNATFTSLRTSPSFVRSFGTILGEQNKVLPKEFQQGALADPFVKNKQFYWWKTLPTSSFIGANAANVIIEHYIAAKPLSDFFAAAFD